MPLPPSRKFLSNTEQPAKKANEQLCERDVTVMKRDTEQKITYYLMEVTDVSNT